MYFSKVKEIVVKNQKVILGLVAFVVLAFAAKKAYEKYVEYKAAEGFSEITFKNKTEDSQSVADRMTEVVYDVSGHEQGCECGDFVAKQEDVPLVEVPAFDSGSQSAFIDKIYTKSEDSLV